MLVTAVAIETLERTYSCQKLSELNCHVRLSEIAKKEKFNIGTYYTL